jgi:hypothetical protein
MAITQPGMFLSQPGMAWLASENCEAIIVSMPSSIRSRICSEYAMRVR